MAIDYIIIDSDYLVIKEMKTWIFTTPLIIETEDNVTREQVIQNLVAQQLIRSEVDNFTLVEIECGEIKEPEF